MRMIFLWRGMIALALLSFCGVTPALAAKYYAPQGNVAASFQITGEGAKPIAGTFADGEASFSFDAQTGTLSDLRLALDARSLSASKASQSALLQELFNPYLHSEIALSAPAPLTLKNQQGENTGTLTLAKQSKPALLKITAGKPDRGAMPLSLELSVKRADFALQSETEGEKDEAKIGDTLTLSLNLTAVGM